MTVSTELSHEEYVGNGVTTDFDFRFRIFEGKHLIVVVADSDGIETTLKNGTDYFIVGAGSYHGGKVVLNKPLAKGWKILLERDLPVVQETDLRNQGKFFAEVHEDAFDYLTMLIQKALGTFSLSLRKPTYLSNYYDAKGNRIANLAPPKTGSDGANKDYVDNRIKDIDSKTLRVNDKAIPALPNVDERAGKVLTFDENGYPIAVAPASGSAVDVINILEKANGADFIAGGILTRYKKKGSFKNGGTVNNANDALIHSDGFYYINIAGNYPVTVEPNSSPDSGWLCVGLLEYFPANYALNFSVSENGDMTDNVRKLHAYCNYSGEEAIYYGVKSFSVDSTADILVSTDVDYCNAKIIPEKTQTLPDWKFIPMFRILDPNYLATPITGINTSSLLQGSSRLTPDNLFDDDGVVCFDTQIPWGARYAGTEAMYNLQQVFKVFSRGQLLRPLDICIGGGDIGTVYYRKNPTSFVTLKNINLDISTDNQLQAFSIERNKTLLHFINLDNKGNKTNSHRQVITLDKVCDVFINKYYGSGSSESNGGSYLLSGSFVAELHLSECGTETGMPTIGFNVLNGVHIDNCYFNRFDCHAWLHNIFTRNLSLGVYGLSFGCGGGVLSMKDTKSYKGYVSGRDNDTVIKQKSFQTVTARYDYGAFWYGTIDIDGIDIYIDKTLDLSAGNLNGPYTIPVLSFESNGDYKFTQRHPVGYTIDIKNVTWHMPTAQAYIDLVGANFGKNEISGGVIFPSSINVSRLKTDSKGGGRWNIIPLVTPKYTAIFSDNKASDTGGNSKITIDKIIGDYSNVRINGLKTIGWYAAIAEQTDEYRVIPNITVSDSFGVHVECTINGSRVKVVNSEIRDVVTFAGLQSNAYVLLNGCDITFIDGSQSSLNNINVVGGSLNRQSSSQGGVRCGSINSSIGLIVLDGIHILDGGNSNVTANSLFTGIKK